MFTLYEIYVEEPRVEVEEGLYTAFCDELGLVSCGKTREEAEDNLNNSIVAYCKALDDRGKLRERLSEKAVEFDIRVISKSYPPKRLIPLLAK